jgi:hypothetical protein
MISARLSADDCRNVEIRGPLGFAIGDSCCCAHSGVQSNKQSRAVRIEIECMTEQTLGPLLEHSATRALRSGEKQLFRSVRLRFLVEIQKDFRCISELFQAPSHLSPRLVDRVSPLDTGTESERRTPA